MTTPSADDISTATATATATATLAATAAPTDADTADAIAALADAAGRTSTELYNYRRDNRTHPTWTVR